MTQNRTSQPIHSTDTWGKALREKRFLCEGMASLLFLGISLYACREVMYYAHGRPGVVLTDPILQFVGPIRLRWPIFAVTWSGFLLAGATLMKTPKCMLTVLQAAAVLVGFRALALYLVPLDPMPTKIPLADPIVIYFSSGVLVTRDLFFSGHTAAMFLLFLSAGARMMKMLFLCATLFIGLGVMLQHVHYSGDVLAAPFFAYGSWRIVVRFHEFLEKAA